MKKTALALALALGSLVATTANAQDASSGFFLDGRVGSASIDEDDFDDDFDDDFEEDWEDDLTEDDE